MSQNEAPPLALPPSSQSDIDEIENLIQSYPTTVLPAHPPSPPRASIPVSSAPPPPPPAPPKPPVPPPRGYTNNATADTLTEPVVDTIKRDLWRIVNNLKLVVFPNPNREDPGKALRDWDLWGPFFFIIFLGLMLSWSTPVQKKKWLGGASERLLVLIILSFSAAASQVFAVAFALLAAGAVILTLNVLLLGGHIIFFQSLSLLGYCIAPLDVGAFICMLKPPVIVKVVVVTVALAWSSWAAYPFISTAVDPQRKALALYPVLLMYVSLGFLIIAID